MTHNPFSEFVKDKHQYAAARFLSLAQAMGREGVGAFTIMRAAESAAWEVALQKNPRDLLKWLDHVVEKAEADRDVVAQIIKEGDVVLRAQLEAQDAAEEAAKAAAKAIQRKA